jgi:hypothetical protein
MSELDCKYLIGKHILDYELFDTKMGIIFRLENENIYMECVPDCCSEAWVEHIENGDYLKDAIVLDCEDDTYGAFGVHVEESDPTYSGRQDRDLKYFLKIKTTKGYVDIDYRNASNGYYGTDLNWWSDKGEAK